MTSDIRAGIELFLKDKFTPGIKTAGASFKDFGGKALSVADSLNSAFSGLAGTISTLGVTIGAGAMLKSWIDIDARMVRIGADIGATADQTNRLKQRLYEVARDPSIKLGTDQLLEAMDAFADRNYDAGFIYDILDEVGIAMRAFNSNGTDMANLFMESFKNGMSTEEIVQSLNDMSVIRDTLKGGFDIDTFAQLLPGLNAVNNILGKSAMSTTELFTAMNILNNGTKGPARSMAAFTAIVNELADPAKQELLHTMKIEVREGAVGDFRDLGDILGEIAAINGDSLNFDRLTKEFSAAALDAVFAYKNYGKMAEGLENLGDTSEEMQKKAADNASTLQANLKNLQTAFMEMSSDKLTGPLKKVNDILNDLSKNPERMDGIINKIIWLGTALAGIRISSGLLSIASNITNVRRGKKTDPLSALGGGSGGAGIPVHVTNWGGASGTGLGGNTTGSGLLDQYGNPLTNTAKPPAPGLSGSTPAKGGIPLGGAITLGITTAAAIYSLVKNVLAPKLAEADPSVPGMSNYYNMNWGARRKAWAKYEAESLGERVSDPRFKVTGYDQHIKAARDARLLKEEMAAVPKIPRGGGNAVLEGSAQLGIDVNIHDDSYEVKSYTINNRTPIELETGSTRKVKGALL